MACGYHPRIMMVSREVGSQPLLLLRAAQVLHLFSQMLGEQLVSAASAGVCISRSVLQSGSFTLRHHDGPCLIQTAHHNLIHSARKPSLRDDDATLGSMGEIIGYSPRV